MASSTTFHVFFSVNENLFLQCYAYALSRFVGFCLFSKNLKQSHCGSILKAHVNWDVVCITWPPAQTQILIKAIFQLRAARSRAGQQRQRRLLAEDKKSPRRRRHGARRTRETSQKSVGGSDEGASRAGGGRSPNVLSDPVLQIFQLACFYETHVDSAFLAL